MRTIVDLPKEQVSALDKIGNQTDQSRAELVRQAISAYLREQKRQQANESLDEYFGFLKDCPEAFDGLDGVAYQDKIRSEWDDRDTKYKNWGMQDNPQEQITPPLSPQNKDK